MLTMLIMTFAVPFVATTSDILSYIALVVLRNLGLIEYIEFDRESDSDSVSDRSSVSDTDSISIDVDNEGVDHDDEGVDYAVSDIHTKKEKIKTE